VERTHPDSGRKADMTLKELDEYLLLASQGKNIPPRLQFDEDEVNQAVTWSLHRDKALGHLHELVLEFAHYMQEFDHAPALFRCALQHHARVQATDVGDDIDALMQDWQMEDLSIRGFTPEDAKSFLQEVLCESNG
jgi:hypothetical protein